MCLWQRLGWSLLNSPYEPWVIVGGFLTLLGIVGTGAKMLVGWIDNYTDTKITKRLAEELPPMRAEIAALRTERDRTRRAMGDASICISDGLQALPQVPENVLAREHITRGHGVLTKAMTGSDA